MGMAKPSFTYSSGSMRSQEATEEPDAGASANGRGAAPSQTEIRFRRFVLRPGDRMLLRDGRPVELGSRAYEILYILACSRGSIVSKEDMISRVWPTTIVEEGNLRLQVAGLRKALGDDRDMIKTVPGRGYLFVAEQPVEDESTDSLIASPIGRSSDEDLERLLSGLQVRHGAKQARALQLPAPLLTLFHSVLDEMLELALRGEIPPGRHLAA